MVAKNLEREKKSPAGLKATAEMRRKQLRRK
jgi:hypothetical protein